jgi:hypothetical protein
MHRRGKRGRSHHRNTTAGFDEVHLIEPADLIGHADSFVELHQICTDAEKDMLAVVDDFSCARMLVRRGSASEERTLLEERNAKADVGKRTGSGESGETASDNGDIRLG